MADKLKNLLLVLLLGVMIALLVLTFLVSVRGSTAGLQLLQPVEEQELSNTEATARAMAQPETLTLMGPDGLYLTCESRDYDLLYQQIEPLFQEAVGSAGELQALTEADYLTMLETSGVLLQYYAPQPLWLLQAWGGSGNLREDLEVSAAAMVADGERVALLLSDREGNRWMAETAASLPELETLSAAAGQCNARFAGQNDAVAADTVLTTVVGRYPTLLVHQPELVTRGELSKSVQSLFGMNAYLTRVYQNTDGSLVYVESHSTISLTPKGDLTYTGTAGIGLELTDSGAARKAELCWKVYDLLCRLWEQAGASGTLSLEEVSLQGDSGTLRFGLRAGGLFLERSEGSWATVTVEDGAITSLTAALRLMEEGASVQLLPAYQAQAVLPKGRAALRVRLLAQEDGLLTPQICRVTEE